MNGCLLFAAALLELRLDVYDIRGDTPELIFVSLEIETGDSSDFAQKRGYMNCKRTTLFP